MTSFPGLDPALGGERRPPAINGTEPQLGGDKRIDLSVLDTLSRGLWTSPVELQRVIRRIPSAQRAAYVAALLARLEFADPDERLPEVAPWRGGRDQRVRILVSLGVLGDASVGADLAPLIDDPNAEVRQAAMTALGRLRDTESVTLLLGVVASPERSIHDRITAAEALADIGSPDAVPGLLECLDPGGSGIVERRVIAALGASGGDEAFVALTELLQQGVDAGIRQEAAYSLGRLNDLRSVPPLSQGLDDPSPDVRYACISALAKLQGPLVRAALTYALSDPDERVRGAADAARRVLPRA